MRGSPKARTAFLVMLVIFDGGTSATAAGRTTLRTDRPRMARRLPIPPIPPRVVPPVFRAGYGPAPVPNMDLAPPANPRASTEPSLAPGVFTRAQQYYGEGFSRGSTAQEVLEKDVQPGAGLSLRVPFQSR